MPSISVDDETHRYLKHLATQQGISVGQAVKLLIGFDEFRTRKFDFTDMKPREIRRVKVADEDQFKEVLYSVMEHNNFHNNKAWACMNEGLTAKIIRHR